MSIELIQLILAIICGVVAPLLGVVVRLMLKVRALESFQSSSEKATDSNRSNIKELYEADAAAREAVFSALNRLTVVEAARDTHEKDAQRIYDKLDRLDEKIDQIQHKDKDR